MQQNSQLYVKVQASYKIATTGYLIMLLTHFYDTLAPSPLPSHFQDFSGSLILRENVMVTCDVHPAPFIWLCRVEPSHTYYIANAVIGDLSVWYLIILRASYNAT